MHLHYIMICGPSHTLAEGAPLVAVASAYGCAALLLMALFTFHLRYGFCSIGLVAVTASARSSDHPA